MQVTEGRPKDTATREYGRFLSKQDLYKLAGNEEGIDGGFYMNNLNRIIEKQALEINRLRAQRDELRALVVQAKPHMVNLAPNQDHPISDWVRRAGASADQQRKVSE